jgi:hypothetical protein
VEVALKASNGLIALGQLDAAQLLLYRAYVALPAGEEGVEISPVMQLFRVVRISPMKIYGEHEELRTVVRHYIEEEEQRKNDGNSILPNLKTFLADSYASQRRWKEAATILEDSLTYCTHTFGHLELYKESYLTHHQLLPQEDDDRLNLENECATSLTRVPDKTASEIADITNIFMDRISIFEGKYEDSPTKVRLADFLYRVKYYEKVLELLGTRIRLRKCNHRMYDRAYK